MDRNHALLTFSFHSLANYYMIVHFSDWQDYTITTKSCLNMLDATRSNIFICALSNFNHFCSHFLTFRRRPPMWGSWSSRDLSIFPSESAHASQIFQSRLIVYFNRNLGLLLAVFSSIFNSTILITRVGGLHCWKISHSSTCSI